jgi:cell division protease FtsH
MKWLDSRRGTFVLVAVLAVLLTASVALAALGSHGRGGDVRRGPLQPKPAESSETSYSDFVHALERGDVAGVTLDAGTGDAHVQFEDGLSAEVVLPVDDAALLREVTESGAVVRITERKVSDGDSIVQTLIPPLLMVAVVFVMFGVISRRTKPAAGLPDMSLRDSAELADVPLERFADVAGCKEAVEELAEVTQFFRDPERFQRLGARLPSGIMLHGEPGTGKTLLAKALAGEAGIPFFATSGSDFVEKFVGVGASRVRELFSKARLHADGAVVFIDEIDAVGRARGGHEANTEREQTLNQILVELDGFSTTDRVICIAATNRLDVLDPALLRPGRFGRHVTVGLPAAEGRGAILRVHAAGKPLAQDVDLDQLAASMGGLSGAQLAEVVNEAAIMAARGGAAEIRRSDFREGYLRVLAGPKRHNAPIAEGELEVIACHEAGHVLCAEYGEQYEKAQQVTVEPRGNAMGLAVYGQLDRALHDPEYLHEALVATVGGRAAEQVVFGRVSSGASNDLQKATELARRAVEELGFSPRLGQIVAGNAPFAETTRAVVDSEIERMVAEAYSDALELLSAHRDQLERLSARLVEARELERIDILVAIGTVTISERRTRRPEPRQSPAPVAKPIPLAASQGPDA